MLLSDCNQDHINQPQSALDTTANVAGHISQVGQQPTLKACCSELLPAQAGANDPAASHEMASPRDSGFLCQGSANLSW